MRALDLELLGVAVYQQKRCGGIRVRDRNSVATNYKILLVQWIKAKALEGPQY